MDICTPCTKTYHLQLPEEMEAIQVVISERINDVCVCLSVCMDYYSAFKREENSNTGYRMDVL